MASAHKWVETATAHSVALPRPRVSPPAPRTLPAQAQKDRENACSFLHGSQSPASPVFSAMLSRSLRTLASRGSVTARAAAAAPRPGVRALRAACTSPPLHCDVLRCERPLRARGRAGRSCVRRASLLVARRSGDADDAVTTRTKSRPRRSGPSTRDHRTPSASLTSTVSSAPWCSAQRRVPRCRRSLLRQPRLPRLLRRRLPRRRARACRRRGCR